MRAFPTASLRAWTDGRWVGRPARPITGFAIDSRQVRPGDCFVALKTAQRDGHAFIGAAMAAGAAAVMVARAPAEDVSALVVPDPEKALQDCAQAHRRDFPGPVIGITGSAGKTSTKEWLHCLLGRERTLATSGNLNNHLGVPLTLLRLDPDQHDAAVIEAGINQRGEMRLLAEMIAPSHGIVTTVALAHAEGIGDLDAIATEKARLLEAVAPAGAILFPATCATYPAFAALAGRAAVSIVRVDTAEPEPPYTHFHALTKPTRTAGTRPEENPRERQSKRLTEPNEPTGEVGPGEMECIHILSPGRPPLVVEAPAQSDGMRQNLVLALLLARRLGVTPAVLQERLLTWQPLARRGEIIATARAVYYVDCYNANPAAMQDAIAFFDRTFSDRDRLFVLGSMNELGDFSERAHEAVGGAVPLRARDRAILIGDQASAMRRGLEARGVRAEQVVEFATAPEARVLVEAFHGAVLLKGSRSYALEQLVPPQPEAGGEAAMAC